MADSATLIVEFNEEDSTCAYGVTAKIEPDPVMSGNIVSIYIYAKDSVELNKLRLYEGSRDMGMGGMHKIETGDMEESLNLSDASYVTASEPIKTTSLITAASEILEINESVLDTLYTKGAVIPISKIGDLCLGLKADHLYGSVLAKYTFYKKYKKYEWLAPDVDVETIFPFFVLKSGKVSLPLDVTVIPKSEPIDVLMVIKNIANEEIISGAIASIYQNDVLIDSQVTDLKGECVFLQLMTTETYDLKVTATGFIDSELDHLNNDSFTIPARTVE
jgi:hypothetical protein